VYACPAIHFVREAQSSAAGPTLDTGGWLALTRPGLSPGKRRRALLGRDNVQAGPPPVAAPERSDGAATGGRAEALVGRMMKSVADHN
jgi:hypothetical protein